MIKVNGIEIGMERFPNGELVIRELESVPLAFELQYENDSDIFTLMAYALLHKKQPKTLHIVYFPYGRADRKVSDKLPTIEAMIELINICKFDLVTVLDAHNSQPLERINNIVFQLPVEKWRQVIERHDIKNICFPDKGAQIRYGKFFPTNTITATKIRCLHTGRILSLDIDGAVPSGESILIIDDLCSKGGTFLLTAQKLKERGAGKIFLFTSHCETTTYSGELFNANTPIEKFYTLENPQLTENHILSFI